MQTTYTEEHSYIQAYSLKEKFQRHRLYHETYHSNELIVKLSLNGIYTYVSPVSTCLLGYSPEEMIGMPATNFLHKEDVEKIRELCEDIKILDISSNDSFKNHFVDTYRIRRKDGTYMWVDFVISLIYHPTTGRPMEFVGVIKNIIGDQKSEELLLQNEKLSVVGQLAAGIAHEIRNPLTSLKGFIQLMKSDIGYNDQYLDIMESEIERIDSISKELMILAKPNKHKFQVVDLEPIILDCISLLEGEAFHKRIEIQFQIEERLFPIHGDEQKIKQVIINIVKNAMEAMDHPGKIIITLKEENNDAILSIQDEGCGIPEKYLESLGKPFFTTKPNGNGLGLMMCYKIIEDHAGTISVQSTLGKGTTFHIHLPLHNHI